MPYFVETTSFSSGERYLGSSTIFFSFNNLYFYISQTWLVLRGTGLLIFRGPIWDLLGLSYINLYIVVLVVLYTNGVILTIPLLFFSPRIKVFSLHLRSSHFGTRSYFSHLYKALAFIPTLSGIHVKCC